MDSLSELQKKETELKGKINLYNEYGVKNPPSKVNYLALVDLIGVQKQIVQIEIRDLGKQYTKITKWDY